MLIIKKSNDIVSIHFQSHDFFDIHKLKLILYYYSTFQVQGFFHA
jgi:hypothetical protein